MLIVESETLPSLEECRANPHRFYIVEASDECDMNEIILGEPNVSGILVRVRKFYDDYDYPSSDYIPRIVNISKSVDIIKRKLKTNPIFKELVIHNFNVDNRILCGMRGDVYQYLIASMNDLIIFAHKLIR